MSTSFESPSHEAVSERARKLWQVAGSPEGRDLTFWLKAEDELRHERMASDDLSSGTKGLGRSQAQKEPSTVGARGPAPAPTAAPFSRSPLPKSGSPGKKSGR